MVKIPKISNWLLKLLGFQSCFLILLCKNFDLYSDPQFVSEDLTRIFMESYTQGFISIFNPLIGVLLPLPRLVMFGAVSVDLLHSPAIVVFSLLLLNTYVLSYFSRDTFRHIVKSDYWRVFFCIAISVGSHGLLFSSLNHFCYSATLLLALVLIEKCSNSRLILIGLLSILSTPFGAVYVPLMILNAIYKKERRVALCILIAVSVLIALISVIATSNSGFQSVRPNYMTIFPSIYLGIINFIFTFFYGRWLTNYSLIYLTSNLYIYIVASMVGVLLANFIIRRITFNRTHAVIIVLLFCTYSTQFVQAMFRINAVATYVNFESYLEGRYAFLPSIIGLLAWFYLIENWKTKWSNLYRLLLNLSFMAFVFANHNHELTKNTWDSFANHLIRYRKDPAYNFKTEISPPPTDWATLTAEASGGKFTYKIIGENS